MPQNAFFLWTRDLLVSQKTTQRHFFSTLHPLSPVIFATATVLAFVLLRNSRFNFHRYTQREATRNRPGSALRLLARKITKRIHSSKPASLNRPIVWEEKCFKVWLERIQRGFLSVTKGTRVIVSGAGLRVGLYFVNRATFRRQRSDWINWCNNYRYAMLPVM